MRCRVGAIDPATSGSDVEAFRRSSISGVVQDVQILTVGDRDGGTRVYQLSPRPDVLWWSRFHAVASRRLGDLGAPTLALVTGHGGDESEISGIAAEASAATDRWMSEVVRETNRAR